MRRSFAGRQAAGALIGSSAVAQPAIPDPVAQRLEVRHAAVARELERVLHTMQEVAASAERSAAERGEAATLAWLWHGSAASMTVNTAG